eukprot:scaffold20873_cov48-Phaeocystis_antarctica.AAC.3
MASARSKVLPPSCADLVRVRVRVRVGVRVRVRVRVRGAAPTLAAPPWPPPPLAPPLRPRPRARCNGPAARRRWWSSPWSSPGSGLGLRVGVGVRGGISHRHGFREHLPLGELHLDDKLDAHPRGGGVHLAAVERVQGEVVLVLARCRPQRLAALAALAARGLVGRLVLRGGGDEGVR